MTKKSNIKSLIEKLVKEQIVKRLTEGKFQGREYPVTKEEPKISGIQPHELAKATPLQKKLVDGFEKREFNVKQVIPSEDGKTINILLVKPGGQFEDDKLLIGHDGSINGKSYKELPVFEGQPVGGVKNDHPFDDGRQSVMKAVNIGENVNRPCNCGSGLESHWVNDGQGIPLARVCNKCKQEKLKKFRPEILKPYSQDDVDEPIEPDESVQEKIGFDGKYVDDMASGVAVKKLHGLDETGGLLYKAPYITVYPEDFRNAKNYIRASKLPNNDEFIVAWYENGRLNEDKSYFTDDAGDAWKTFTAMKPSVDRANGGSMNEETGTGAVAGYQTPYAFSKKSGSKRALDATIKMGYKKVKDID